MNDRKSASVPTPNDKHVFDKPGNVRAVLMLLYIICALLGIADFVLHRHVEHPLESLPAFYAVYGFVGCVSLVLVAKELRKWVKREETYYED